MRTNTYELSLIILSIIKDLEKGVAMLDEPTRSQFQKALATTKEEPMLKQAPDSWISSFNAAGPFTEDSIKNVQSYFERVSVQIKDEIKDLTKILEIMDALRSKFVPELDKAMFPGTQVA